MLSLQRLWDMRPKANTTCPLVATRYFTYWISLCLPASKTLFSRRNNLPVQIQRKWIVTLFAERAVLRCSRRLKMGLHLLGHAALSPFLSAGL